MLRSRSALRCAMYCLALAVLLLVPATAHTEEGNNWIDLPQSVPQPTTRTDVPMVCASQINRMILTSGLGAQPVFETWSYELEAHRWTLLIEGPAGAITPARKAVNSQADLSGISYNLNAKNGYYLFRVFKSP